MAILVLGGAGYIGSHTVRALQEAGRDIVVLDNLQSGYRKAVPAEVPFYQIDIRDRAALDQVFEQEEIEACIHFAANSLVGESMQKPLLYYNNNVYGTAVLLQSMLAHDVRHIVFSSTAATYGEATRMPILETDPTEPTNVYGETKRTMEKMIAWVAHAHELSYVALRYFNAAGAHPSGEIGEAHQPETHLIPLVLQVANGQRDSITIFGNDYPTPDGTCLRDYIHVMDLAAAHILALDYLLAGGASKIFNLGNGTAFSVHQIIEVCRQVTGHPIPTVMGERRPGDPAQLIASSDKITKELGWQPQYAQLEQIVASAWHWHQKHPRGFSD